MSFLIQASLIGLIVYGAFEVGMWHQRERMAEEWEELEAEWAELELEKRRWARKPSSN